jgi:hypothetical protein
LSLSASPERPAAPTILVGVDLGLPHFDAELEELGLLAHTAGLTPVARVACRRKAPDAALFIGKGKADEIKALAEQTGATEILFDQALSPAQQRNLERHLDLPVNDRTLLILEIFGQRARSHEGKLQVELARLQYVSTRLVRRWSHLERQTGGAGLRGGPGEKQIELDRRMIGDAIRRTRERLEKVKKQRHTQRRQRERRGAFNISLIGYTNAGKSTGCGFVPGGLWRHPQQPRPWRHLTFSHIRRSAVPTRLRLAELLSEPTFNSSNRAKAECIVDAKPKRPKKEPSRAPAREPVPDMGPPPSEIEEPPQTEEAPVKEPNRKRPKRA